MATYDISRSFKWQGTITDKVASVCRMFGLTVDRLAERCFTHDCQLEINNGDIVYLTGPSGAGKSVLLDEFEKCISVSDRVNLAQIELPSDKTLIDCIDADLLTSLRLLSTAGLSDCFCILNQPRNLSAGEKYRFRLAMALAAEKQFVFGDEFCSELDRITAAVISHRLHTFAKRTGTTFVLASSHQDILLDLEPDVLVVKELSGPTQVIYKHKKR
ncbi:MAG: ATP-binding cassette domain-containing protein [Planctomycetota bacterium]